MGGGLGGGWAMRQVDAGGWCRSGFIQPHAARVHMRTPAALDLPAATGGAAAAAVSFIGSSFQLTGIILVRSVSQWSGVVSAVAVAVGAGAAAVAAAVAVEGSLSQLHDGSEW